jgi:3-oxoacyl-[acyl-carrier protein] reductase
MQLKGEVALVTGASRGIGRAIALALGRAGAHVVGTATSVAGAEAIGKTLQDAGLQGQGKALDVNSQVAIEQVLKSLEDSCGAPTILINNAGIARDNLLLRMSEEEWDTILNTNLKSVYRLSRACLRPMMKARRGRIISIASIIGVTGNAGQANYAAAKAGIIGFTKSLAREIGSRNITVNAVAPGFIETDMTRTFSAAQRLALLGQIPLAKLGSPEDIAQVVAFLASPAAAYITGTTLHVNGGMYMN